MKKLQSSSRKTRCFVSKCGRHLGNKIVKIQVNLDKKIHKLNNNIPINIWERFFRRKVVSWGFFLLFLAKFLQSPRNFQERKNMSAWTNFPAQTCSKLRYRIVLYRKFSYFTSEVIRKFALFTFYCKRFYILQNLSLKLRIYLLSVAVFSSMSIYFVVRINKKLSP